MIKACDLRQHQGAGVEVALLFRAPVKGTDDGMVLMRREGAFLVLSFPMLPFDPLDSLE